MSLVSPVTPEQASDKVAQVYDRIREVMLVTEIPEVFQWLAAVPSFLHDFFMNFRKFVLSEGKLDVKSKLLIAIAVAGQAGSSRWLAYLQTFAEKSGVSEQDIGGNAGRRCHEFDVQRAFQVSGYQRVGCVQRDERRVARSHVSVHIPG